MPAGLTSEYAVRLVYARANAAHAWYWFPELAPEEVRAPQIVRLFVYDYIPAMAILASYFGATYFTLGRALQAV